MPFDEKDYRNSSHHLKEIKKRATKIRENVIIYQRKIKEGNKNQQKLLAAVHKQKICEEKEGEGELMNITFTYLKVGVPTETFTPG